MIQLGTAGRRFGRILQLAGRNAGADLNHWKGRKGRHSVGPVKWLKFAILTGCLAVFSLLFLDAPAAGYRSEWPPGLVAWASAVTDIGKSKWYLVPTGLFMLVLLMLDWQRMGRRYRWLLANAYILTSYVFVTVAVSGLIVTSLKRIIGRARPRHFEEHSILAFENFARDASFASFPSGHATTVGAVAAIIALLYPRVRILALSLAAILGATRMIVGAHYPSDVIVGLAFGMWFAYFTALMFASRGLLFSCQSGGLPTVRRSFARSAAMLFSIPIPQGLSKDM